MVITIATASTSLIQNLFNLNIQRWQIKCALLRIDSSLRIDTREAQGADIGKKGTSACPTA